MNNIETKIENLIKPKIRKLLIDDIELILCDVKKLEKIKREEDKKGYDKGELEMWIDFTPSKPIFMTFISPISQNKKESWKNAARSYKVGMIDLPLTIFENMIQNLIKSIKEGKMDDIIYQAPKYIIYKLMLNVSANKIREHVNGWHPESQ